MTCPRRQHDPRLVLLIAIAGLLISLTGCSKEEAANDLKEVEAAAENAAKEVAEDVGNLVEQGEKMAGDLSEQAEAYFVPLKEKFSSLEELKETPEQLKSAVVGLIESIEQKAETVKLPETVSVALENVKEKLIALRDYLGGEYEQAKINERVDEIMESVKSGLGLSQD